MAEAGSSRGPPKRPPEDKLFCPRQDSIEDIPICTYDIASGVDGFKNMLQSMRIRQENLAPFTVGTPEIPVTPLQNPKTKLSSHFIVRLFNSENLMYSVDCLLRDTDLYFVGFRRCLVLSPEELHAHHHHQSIKKTMKMRATGWGCWYCFHDDDMPVPVFLAAKSCGISNGYSNGNLITSGGRLALEDLLLTLGTFEDNPSTDKKNIQRACYRVMTTICEPCRLRTVREEMIVRIEQDMEAHRLSQSLWADIGAWKHLGDAALKCHVNSSHALSQKFAARYELSNASDLIGPNGRVMLIKSNKENMVGFTVAEIDDLSIKARNRNNGPADRIDPGFQRQEKPADATSRSRKKGARRK